jgi:hypothetical protein
VADLHFDFGKLDILMDVKRLHVFLIERRMPA